MQQDNIKRLLQNGHVAEARKAYLGLCLKNKNDFAAWYNYAMLCGQTGELEGAVEGFYNASKLVPDNAQIHFNLGTALQQSGDHARAITSFKRAVELQPDLAEAHYNLGNAFYSQCEYKKAEGCYQTALSIKPEYLDSALNLISTLLVNGKPEDAANMCDRILGNGNISSDIFLKLGDIYNSQSKSDIALNYYRNASEAGSPDYAFNLKLGDAFYNAGQMTGARLHYQKAIEADATKPAAWVGSGNSSFFSGQSEDALDAYNNALKIDPEDAKSHINIGMVHLKEGRNKQALWYADKALEIDPDSTDAAALQANIHEKAGNLDEAYSIIQPACEKRSAEPNSALVYATVCKQLNRAEEALPAINTQLNRNDISIRSRRHLHFMAGDLYDKIGEYDQAFEHYSEGNRLKGAIFNPAENSKLIDRVISTFSKGFLDHCPSSGLESSKPVFVVGMPRSGTSLVEQILASHPQVHGAGELQFIHDVACSSPDQSVSKTPYPECAEQLTSSRLSDISSQYLDYISELHPVASRIADKLPGNFMYLGLIQMLFPGTRIIHCTRDPLDTCLSCYFQDFFGPLPYTYNLDHLGHYYNDYHRLMKHWTSTLELPLMSIRYSDLVNDQEIFSRRLIDFCELPWDDACLDFYKSDRIVRTVSYAQVRKPIYRGSLGRWKNYQRHIKPLIDFLDGTSET